MTRPLPSFLPLGRISGRFCYFSAGCWFEVPGEIQNFSQRTWRHNTSSPPSSFSPHLILLLFLLSIPPLFFYRSKPSCFTCRAPPRDCCWGWQARLLQRGCHTRTPCLASERATQPQREVLRSEEEQGPISAAAPQVFLLSWILIPHELVRQLMSDSRKQAFMSAETTPTRQSSSPLVARHHPGYGLSGSPLPPSQSDSPRRSTSAAAVMGTATLEPHPNLLLGPTTPPFPPHAGIRSRQEVF